MILLSAVSKDPSDMDAAEGQSLNMECSRLELSFKSMLGVDSRYLRKPSSDCVVLKVNSVFPQVLSSANTSPRRGVEFNDE